MAVPVIGVRELELVTDALRSGWVAQGRYIGEFEAAFSQFCGVQHGIAVSSGTTALHLALAALGIGPGDEVIVPAMTHIATANAVTLVGARLVPADCSLTTWTVDPEQVKTRLTPRTKAVIVVHLYGHPVNMDPITELSEKHGFAVIEDAAESHGAEYRGRRTGSLGHLGCFSFYANKMITTGEGGMITTNDPALASQARKLRDQAYDPACRFLHSELGFNYRITNMQAALGLAQMERIDDFIARRRSNAAIYTKVLCDVAGVTTPPEARWAKNVYWMYSILVDHKEFGLRRAALMRRLKARNIDARTFFVPLHLQPLYATHFQGQSFPVSEYLYERGINLPSGNELQDASVRRVAEAVKSAVPRAAYNVS